MCSVGPRDAEMLKAASDSRTKGFVSDVVLFRVVVSSAGSHGNPRLAGPGRVLFLQLLHLRGTEKSRYISPDPLLPVSIFLLLPKVSG